MSILLLALALAGPGEQDSQQHRSRDELACTLRVHALDELGQPQSARRVSATAVGGLPTLVSDGFNGRLVPEANVDAFGKALLELCADSKLRVWMGLNCLERVEEFSLARMVDRVEETYGTKPSRAFGCVTGSRPESGALAVHQAPVRSLNG